MAGKLDRSFPEGQEPTASPPFPLHGNGTARQHGGELVYGAGQAYAEMLE